MILGPTPLVIVSAWASYSGRSLQLTLQDKQKLIASSISRCKATATPTSEVGRDKAARWIKRVVLVLNLTYSVVCSWNQHAEILSFVRLVCEA